MINLFINKYDVAYMTAHNGDIVVKNPISCVVEMKRNGIWYCTLEIPMAETNGIVPKEETVIKTNLNYADNQLFRTIYVQSNWSKHTYKLYANHIFFDAQKETYYLARGTNPRTTDFLDWKTYLSELSAFDNQNNPSQWYQLRGNSIHSVYHKETPKDIVDGDTYILCNGSDTNYYCIDVPYQDMLPCNLQYHDMNKTLAQLFIFEKYDNTYWIVRNKKSGLVLDVNGGGSDVGTPVAQSTYHGGDNQLWKIEKVTYDSNQQYRLRPKNAPTLALNHPSGLTSGSITIGYVGSAVSGWGIVEPYAFYKDVSEEKINIIESLFGTQDYSMVKAFEEVELDHVTAMFDNLTCYFGSALENYYSDPSTLVDVSYVKPKTYKIKATKEKLDLVEKVTIENVLTGIVPVGYNNRRLPLQEIVKSDKWYDYRIHRVEEVEYPEVVLLEDNPSADYFKDDVYDTIDQVYSALRQKAKDDLNKEIRKYPTREVTFKSDYIFSDENIAKNIKLNDILYIGDDTAFYFDGMKYDAINERVTDVTLKQFEG